MTISNASSTHPAIRVAIVTGGSQGFGLALTAALTARGTTVVTCARDAARLHDALRALPHPERTVAVPGDVTDAGHRAELIAATRSLGGGLDLLVHNAGDLGPSPLPPLAGYPVDALHAVLESNLVAPLALTQLALPSLRAAAAPAIVMLSSDAAVEAYPGWGGYGAAKAALDQLAAVLGVELGGVELGNDVQPGQPGHLTGDGDFGEDFDGDAAFGDGTVRVYSFDPGDMRTTMHQRAFPGEDISDRPEPATAVPALLRLLDERPSSGRFRAADLAAAAVAGDTR